MLGDKLMPEAPQACEPTTGQTETNSFQIQKLWNAKQWDDFWGVKEDTKATYTDKSLTSGPSNPRGYDTPWQTGGHEGSNQITSQYTRSESGEETAGSIPLGHHEASHHQEQHGCQNTAPITTRLDHNMLSARGGNASQPKSPYPDTHDQPALSNTCTLTGTEEINSPSIATRGPLPSTAYNLEPNPNRRKRCSSSPHQESGSQDRPSWQNLEYRPHNLSQRKTKTAFIPSEHFAVNIAKSSRNLSFDRATEDDKSGWRVKLNPYSRCSGVPNGTCRKSNKRLVHQWEGSKIGDVRITALGLFCDTCHATGWHPLPTCGYGSGQCDVWSSRHLTNGKNSLSTGYCPAHFFGRAQHMREYRKRLKEKTIT